ncbi:Tim44 domain-containing protein [Ancylobacter lacus]|nr:Tim44/TimA family putative adaptor protein [Ancylobacter lacus]MBS7537602.1 Tim44 domain-containing protein [Ancylobacter lacus]
MAGWSAVQAKRGKSDVFDIYTIIFLALAVFIFIRLRSVLGQRTGRERPPYDPYSRRDAAKAPAANDPRASDKVVNFPGTEPSHVPEPVEPDVPAQPRWTGVAEIGSAVANGLDAIAAQERGFDVKHFLEGARSAYEMIVVAFANGDRRALKDLLARDVFDGFSAAIAEREARGETMQTSFVAISKSDIVDAQVKGKTAQITVRFVSQLISVTRNAAGETVDGDAEAVVDVTDVWTFSRDLGARDPNWKLVATEAAS